jgi:hypothetical protein
MEMKEKVHAVNGVFCGRNDVAFISIIIGKKYVNYGDVKTINN